MSQQELLSWLVAALEGLAVEYFITGSWSSSLQGEPRSTHDLDVVIALGSEQIDPLLAGLDQQRFYFSEQAARDAVARRSRFNVLDTAGGDQVDFWLLTDDPWDQSRMARRVPVQALGVETYFPTPEDTILAKRRWADLSGGSQKQMSDARGVLLAPSGQLDLDYIQTWAERLGVTPLWRSICESGGQCKRVFPKAAGAQAILRRRLNAACPAPREPAAMSSRPAISPARGRPSRGNGSWKQRCDSAPLHRTRRA